MAIITFKSNPQNFNKEYADIKNNTVRKVDQSDDRFKRLKELYDNNYWFMEYIRIKNSENESQYFDKKIRDITFFEDLCIITWYEDKLLL